MLSAARFRLILAFILLGACAVYLIGNQRTGLWDRDEPWYAQCSREMLQSGDWVVPKFLGAWRLEKPPLIYWCQATAMKFLGDGPDTAPEAARLPSALFVLGTGLILGLIVRRVAGPRRGLWTAFIFCTCGLAAAAAKFCNTDAALAFFVIAGQACLAVLYRAHLRRESPPIWAAPVFWISTGLAGLTKGPQVLGMHIVMLLILLALDASQNITSPKAWLRAAGWWKQLRPAIGLPILLLITIPWLIMVHHRAPGFLDELWHKAKLHSVTSMDGHGEPPGYHLLLIFGTFFPWSVLLPTTISLAWQHRRIPTIRFAMAATVGPWLLMELVRTKLPFYVMPAFGGLSFLTADALIRCIRGQHKDLRQKAFLASVAVWAIAGLGLGAAPWSTAFASRDLPWISMILFSIGAVLFVAIVCHYFLKGRLQPAAIAMGVGTSLLIIMLFGTLFPNFHFLQISERIANDLPPNARGPNAPLAMIGYVEPSLAFYQGGGARECADDYLQATPTSQWPTWIAINQTAWNNVPPQIQQFLHLQATEQGIAYATTGRPETVMLLRKN
jgi:4-amino-4-deoxy-L-arabinose transferase-like glycosyltransferase